MNHISHALLSNPNICLSGGAPGADLLWGTLALAQSHALIHWSFPTHTSPAPPSSLILLSDAELALGTRAVAAAATVLGRNPPRRPHVWRLLHRNYYQVAWAEKCYAVTVLPGEGEGEERKVRGTAWAVSMFAATHSAGSGRMWVFDQEADAWFEWKRDKEGREWERMEGRPPKPEGVWAGIGTRQLEGNGRRAIEEVMFG